ncbi:MAG: hypothetical protein WBI14_08810 [Anaerolineaceae bacterium]
MINVVGSGIVGNQFEFPDVIVERTLGKVLAFAVQQERIYPSMQIIRNRRFLGNSLAMIGAIDRRSPE